MRDSVPTFPARLRQLREAAGWSQAELATRSGTHWASIAKLEGATRAPSLRLAWALAQALGVTVDDLLQDAGTPVRRARGRPQKKNLEKIAE